MIRSLSNLAAVAVTLVTSGCASIVSGTNQSLSVTSKNKGEVHSGAKCTLVNDKGTWYVTTPGSVTVRRSFNDLSVNCAADAVEPGIAIVKSSTKGMAFGNILFGGVIGVGVDAATGAAYDYPEIILVEMGQTAVQAPPANAGANKTNTGNGPASGTPGGGVAPAGAAASAPAGATVPATPPAAATPPAPAASAA
ncbi:hypothetical protein BH11PSE8_BH11PSE8_13470 [soil metagenome]